MCYPQNDCCPNPPFAKAAVDNKARLAFVLRPMQRRCCGRHGHLQVTIVSDGDSLSAHVSIAWDNGADENCHAAYTMSSAEIYVRLLAPCVNQAHEGKGSKEHIEAATMDDPADKLHEVLQSASDHVPRYLFRVFHATPGGDATLNTTMAITPSAFMDTEAPKSIADITKRELLRTLGGHLRVHKNIKTSFSSWLGTLSFAFKLVTASSPGEPLTNLHLAIVDTHNLGPDNLAFWAGASSFQELDIGVWSDEYPIYGIATGPCYAAAPTDALTATGTTVGVNWQLPSGVEACIQAFKRFGKAFELVAAVHLLCRAQGISKDEQLLNRLLRELETPMDVGEHPNIHVHSRRGVDVQREIGRCNLALAAQGDKVRARAKAPQPGSEIAEGEKKRKTRWD